MNIIERAELGQSFLVADDGQYLGTLTLNQYDTESISNSHGCYGSVHSLTSIKNPNSQYGSPYSSLSPFNKCSSTPPTIYINGKKYGALTKNSSQSGINIDPDALNELMDTNDLNS
jgi:hypothetical protein